MRGRCTPVIQYDTPALALRGIVGTHGHEPPGSTGTDVCMFNPYRAGHSPAYVLLCVCAAGWLHASMRWSLQRLTCIISLLVRLDGYVSNACLHMCV